MITLNACVHEQLAGSSTSRAPAFASKVHRPFMLHGACCGPGQAYSLRGEHSQTTQDHAQSRKRQTNTLN